jgi:hypothetical protein
MTTLLTVAPTGSCTDSHGFVLTCVWQNPDPHAPSIQFCAIWPSYVELNVALTLGTSDSVSTGGMGGGSCGGGGGGGLGGKATVVSDTLKLLADTPSSLASVVEIVFELSVVLRAVSASEGVP